jgi:hypothetical protein
VDLRGDEGNRAGDNRHHGSAAASVGTLSAAQAAQLAALEEEVVKNVEEAVRKKVEEMMESEEVQLRIQVRSWKGTTRQRSQSSDCNRTC